MSEQIISLRPEHSPQILEFEKQRLAEKVSDVMERELQSWNAPWREEALQHYLQLGWSFGIWQEEKLLAYALAQPLIFFEGLTQTLWVEYLGAQKESHAEDLLITLQRWARDKHLQRVMVAKNFDFPQLEQKLAFETWSPRVGILKSSKMRG